MRADGLVGAHARRKWRRGNDKMVPAPDLLQRDFTAERSDLRWVADISEFHCNDGKLYLAGIRDLHDHSLVGWSMGERQTTDLVVAALVMALGRRSPATTSCTTPTTAANTPASSSPTGSPTGASPAATAASATAGITPPWNRSGPPQEGAPPHPRPTRAVHPQPAPHHPVRLHRGLLQPLTPPARPGRPHPRRDHAASRQPDPSQQRVHEIVKSIYATERSSRASASELVGGSRW